MGQAQHHSEPENLTRRVYGFDTFDGFPSVSEEDQTSAGVAVPRISDLEPRGTYGADPAYDQDRFLGHIPEVELIAGDATKTMPEFVQRMNTCW